MNAGSVHVHVGLTLTTGDPDVRSSVTDTGNFSWTLYAGELEMTTDLSNGSRTTMSQIIDGNRYYTKTQSITGIPASALGALLGGWDEFIWSGPRPALSSTGLWGLLGAASGQVDPATVVGVLKADASSVANLGRGKLDGVDTTRYRAVIPLARLVPKSAVTEAERVLGSASITVDYWIDSSKRLRQLTLSYTVSRAPTVTTTTVSGETSFSVRVRYPVIFSEELQLSNYGIPVHVVPPSENEVTSRQTCVSAGDGFTCQ